MRMGMSRCCDYDYRELRIDNRVRVVYDKGKDNDGTLKTKLVQAMTKTGYSANNFNPLMKELKSKGFVMVGHAW